MRRAWFRAPPKPSARAVSVSSARSPFGFLCQTDCLVGMLLSHLCQMNSVAVIGLGRFARCFLEMQLREPVFVRSILFGPCVSRFFQFRGSAARRDRIHG